MVPATWRRTPGLGRAETAGGSQNDRRDAITFAIERPEFTRFAESASGGLVRVLVDAQFITEDVASLAEFVAPSGRTLRTIFVTHGHGDHCFGADHLADRFANARRPLKTWSRR